MSVCWVSAEANPWVTPDNPPMVNIATKEMAYIIATVMRMRPPHIVAIQLRTFTPVGTAMVNVASENAVTDIGPMPEANMWWAHTPKPRKPIAIPEKMTKR